MAPAGYSYSCTICRSQHTRGWILKFRLNLMHRYVCRVNLEQSRNWGTRGHTQQIRQAGLRHFGPQARAWHKYVAHAELKQLIAICTPQTRPSTSAIVERAHCARYGLQQHVQQPHDGGARQAGRGSCEPPWWWPPRAPRWVPSRRCRLAPPTWTPAPGPHHCCASASALEQMDGQLHT